MTNADLFSRFSYEMGKSQFYPPSAPELSENRLFGMFHASTPQHSKDVIMESLQYCGTVRVVFASVAMGMGIDLHGVDTIIHYGAPSSIENYFQGSGRRGRSGDSAYSSVFSPGPLSVSARYAFAIVSVSADIPYSRVVK